MIYSSSLYSTAKMILVITSSILNGPIVNFSASITATGSFDPGFGSWAWGVGEQSIISVNELFYISSSLTGSEVQSLLSLTDYYAGFNIPNECDNILTDFISGSNITDLFSSLGVTLG